MPPLQQPPSDGEAIVDLTPDEFCLLLPHIIDNSFSLSRCPNPQKKKIEGKKMPPLQHTQSDGEAFDLLPDDLLLHILNYVSSDINSLCRCSSVSRRFCLLVPLVSSLLIPADCLFDPWIFPVSFSGDKPRLYFSRFSFLSSVVRSFVSNLPLQPLLFNSSEPCPIHIFPSVTHRTPIQVLKNFSHLRTLHIDLPSAELSFNDSPSTLLRWRAHFGSSLDRCLILSASASDKTLSSRTGTESLYPKLGMAWTTYSLFAAAGRHYLVEPIITEHTSLERVVVTDADGQGMLCMDRDQLVELRKKPIWACMLSKRTMIPARGTWEWYAPVVELSCGVVLKGVTLEAVQPSNVGEKKEEAMGLGWIEEEFDGDGNGNGMYAEAVRLLLKEKPCYEQKGPL